MKKQYPPIQELQSLLKYDPETGHIYWIAKGRGRIKKKEAGTQEINGYRGILIKGKRIRSHIIAWALYNGKYPENQIDHINGVKSDNRICNLREATNSQNGKNLPIKKNNTSGYPGVYFRCGKWRVQIKVDYQSISLGTYFNFNDAIEARKMAEVKYYGEWRHYK